MHIIKPVQIKQVITENSKRELTDEFIEKKDRLSLECDQLQFEQLKLKKKYPEKTDQIDAKIQEEILERQDKIEAIEFKLSQLNELEIGSEIIEGEIHSIQEVKVGDDWSHFTSDQSIVIKDNKVIKIDE